MSSETSYASWTKTGLVQRVKELEAELNSKRRLEASPQPVAAASCASEKTPEPKRARPVKARRKIDPSRYSRRFIALKLAYLGKNYGGFEFQAMGNQPSIEEELWKALTKACLIFPEDERVVQFDCCEYSKCGRTDRGVSAFGQVIGLQVRSNRPIPRAKKEDEDEEAGSEDGSTEAFDDIQDELCYPRILNRLLPDDIRILAWCPSPPADFSARFSCRERQYRYFFTQPAYASGVFPDSTTTTRGWLEIEAMRDAAKRFEGEHDFRNFCKIDASKQITNFQRRIFEADVVEVPGSHLALPWLQQRDDDDDTSPSTRVYYFHVRGSAFLWHQIRHMVAILFLVGQGLESPTVVSELLDTHKNPSRPSYVMADEVPLVLWDCIFPSDLDADAVDEDAEQQRTDALEWIYPGDVLGQLGVMKSTWQLWRGHKMDEILSSQLLQQIWHKASSQNQGSSGGGGGGSSANDANNSVEIFEGGNTSRLGGRYVPVMKKELLQSPEEQNDKYAQRKGFTDAADMRARKLES